MINYYPLHYWNMMWKEKYEKLWAYVTQQMKYPRILALHATYGSARTHFVFLDCRIRFKFQSAFFRKLQHFLYSHKKFQFPYLAIGSNLMSNFVDSLTTLSGTFLLIVFQEIIDLSAKWESPFKNNICMCFRTITDTPHKHATRIEQKKNTNRNAFSFVISIVPFKQLALQKLYGIEIKFD